MILCCYLDPTSRLHTLHQEERSRRISNRLTIQHPLDRQRPQLIDREGSFEGRMIPFGFVPTTSCADGRRTLKPPVDAVGGVDGSERKRATFARGGDLSFFGKDGR